MVSFLDVARPRQAIGQAERREASPRGSVGGGRASSRKCVQVTRHKFEVPGGRNMSGNLTEL
eukprot:1191886-Prorocentrum_minimum.AAC.1